MRVDLGSGDAREYFLLHGIKRECGFNTATVTLAVSGIDDVQSPDRILLSGTSMGSFDSGIFIELPAEAFFPRFGSLQWVVSEAADGVVRVPRWVS